MNEDGRSSTIKFVENGFQVSISLIYAVMIGEHTNAGSMQFIERVRDLNQAAFHVGQRQSNPKPKPIGVSLLEISSKSIAFARQLSCVAVVVRKKMGPGIGDAQDGFGDADAIHPSQMSIFIPFLSSVRLRACHVGFTTCRRRATKTYREWSLELRFLTGFAPKRWHEMRMRVDARDNHIEGLPLQTRILCQGAVLTG